MMSKTKWTFIKDDLEVEISVFAVDFRAAQSCLGLLLKYYERDEWRVKEAADREIITSRTDEHGITHIMVDGVSFMTMHFGRDGHEVPPIKLRVLNLNISQLWESPYKVWKIHRDEVAGFTHIGLEKGVVEETLEEKVEREADERYRDEHGLDANGKPIVYPGEEEPKEAS